VIQHMTFTCAYCHRQCEGNSTKEHLIPKCYMGTLKIKNVCIECNRQRSNRCDYEPFLMYLLDHPVIWDRAKRRARKKVKKAEERARKGKSRSKDVKRAVKLEPFIQKTEACMKKLIEAQHMPFVCLYCKKTRKKNTTEHIIPHEIGGVLTTKNVCEQCHEARDNGYNHKPFLRYLSENPSVWIRARTMSQQNVECHGGESKQKNALAEFISGVETQLDSDVDISETEMQVVDEDQEAHWMDRFDKLENLLSTSLMDRFDKFENRLSSENHYEEFENRLSSTMRNVFGLLERMEMRLIFLEGRAVLK